MIISISATGKAPSRASSHAEKKAALSFKPMLLIAVVKAIPDSIIKAIKRPTSASRALTAMFGRSFFAPLVTKTVIANPIGMMVTAAVKNELIQALKKVSVKPKFK